MNEINYTDVIGSGIMILLIIWLLVYVARSIFAYATDRPQPKSAFIDTLASILIIFFVANLFKRD
jgi:hypothetical protein